MLGSLTVPEYEVGEECASTEARASNFATKELTPAAFVQVSQFPYL
jgi:hypothetical protein